MMIFATKERAEQAAAELNQRPGRPKAQTVLIAEGWTVIASYKFGLSGPGAKQLN